MSIVAQTRRHVMAWATRASVRPMAIIPGSHQEPLKKAANRMDFWGEDQGIDSRYALLEKVRKQGLKIDERFRKDGKGFVKPWEVETKLEEVVDPIAHGKK